jgi:hypothetical protein
MLTFDRCLEPRLRELMIEQGDDFVAIAEHARRWVCDPAGFTTSPACLLRPLGDVLAEVAAGFGALGSAVEESWSEVRRDTDRTLASYVEVDGSVSAGLARLTGRLA